MTGQTQCDISNCRADLGAGQIALGLRLCAGCRNAVASRLATLPGFYEECGHFLDTYRGHRGERVSGWRPNGISLNEAAVTARSNIVTVLASWCGMVVDERRVTGPGRRAVGSLATFLRTHLDWLATHPAAADLAGEIAELVAAVQKVIHHPDQRRHIDLGACVQPGCDRAVLATIGAAGDSSVHPAGPGVVACEAGHVWQPHQWLLLGQRIERLRHRLAQVRWERGADSVSLEALT